MSKFGIGQPVRRVEDQRFLTGRGNFVDDVILPQQAYGALVLSPHAHAKIISIDTSAASAAPGVLCVLTGKDAIADKIGGLPPYFLPVAWGGPPAFSTTRPILIADRVRCIGDRVAYVVAETAAQARDAADLIKVEYEVLPCIVDVEKAARDDAPKVWDECNTGNVSVRLQFGDTAATDAAFASAKHKVSLRVENNRVSANSLEPRASNGQYDPGTGTFTLYTTSQDPHSVRHSLAEQIFHLPETSFRVISPDVGGGFGMKSNIYPDDVLVLWASRRCGRPVKWTATRSEALLLDTQAREQVVTGELALDENGKILALRSSAVQAIGAYYTAAMTAPLFFSLFFITSVYDIKTIDVSTAGVFTHTPPVSVYRGAGRPEAIYLMERLIEAAARETGIDQVTIRKRNLIPQSALPYETVTHQHYDSGDFAGLMEKCLANSDWDGYAARAQESAARGKLRGRSVTPYIELGGVFNDRMEIRFDPGGTLSIFAGTHSHGQGHATAFAQLVSQWLGVPFESIRYVQGDTQQVSFGRGTFAARSSMVGGGALRAAADNIIARGKLMASAILEASENDLDFKEGRYHVVGTDKSIGLTDVAKAFFAPAGPVLKFGLGLEASGTYSGVPGGAPNYPNGCQVCEVEVDPQTGDVRIDRFTVVDDLGMIINPMICEGQIHGAIAQGAGQALREKVMIEPSSGQLQSGSFMDYGLPRAADFPHFASELVEIPAKTNPLGVKGIGESGTVGAPAALVNAVLDAVRPAGVKDLSMPLTPQRVWGALQAAR
jgi:carbon-monoxide dehydrogenase large subunit